MAISTQIPTSWKLPLFWATVDGSQAGLLNEVEPALLVGQMFTSGPNAGSATPNTPIPIGSEALAKQYFGAGSMVARMVAAFLNNNTTQQLWAIGIPDPNAGVAASGSIKISTAATQSGVLTVYIAGQKVQCTIYSTDTAAGIATKLSAAINAIVDMPAAAVVDSVDNTKVDLQCKWLGDTGNDITIIPNYLGAPGGEYLPVGMTLTIVAMANGNGQPDFTAAISAIQATEFDYVALPYTDSGSQLVWATEYGFGPTGRWSYTRQQYGFIVNAYRNDYADSVTWGLSQNQPVISTLAIEQGSPTPVWEWTASYCADAALGFTDDPARPLQTLMLNGCLPAPVQNRYSAMQANNLINSGLAVQQTGPDGVPRIMREETQYQFNAYGQSDLAFGLLTVLATLATLLRRMKSAITTKYPRVKLVPDGTKIGPGQAAVQPGDIKAELVAEFQQAAFDGLVANLDAFKQNLLVEINDNDPNRLDVLWPPQLAGQLRVFAALAQFRLLNPIPVS